jgi:hypothetical protein
MGASLGMETSVSHADRGAPEGWRRASRCRSDQRGHGGTATTCPAVRSADRW